jgi:hypothetical protein
MHESALQAQLVLRKICAEHCAAAQPCGAVLALQAVAPSSLTGLLWLLEVKST